MRLKKIANEESSQEKGKMWGFKEQKLRFFPISSIKLWTEKLTVKRLRQK